MMSMGWLYRLEHLNPELQPQAEKFRQTVQLAYAQARMEFWYHHWRFYAKDKLWTGINTYPLLIQAMVKCMIARHRVRKAENIPDLPINSMEMAYGTVLKKIRLSIEATNAIEDSTREARREKERAMWILTKTGNILTALLNSKPALAPLEDGNEITENDVVTLPDEDEYQFDKRHPYPYRLILWQKTFGPIVSDSSTGSASSVHESSPDPAIVDESSQDAPTAPYTDLPPSPGEIPSRPYFIGFDENIDEPFAPNKRACRLQMSPPIEAGEISDPLYEREDLPDSENGETTDADRAPSSERPVSPALSSATVRTREGTVEMSPQPEADSGILTP